MKLHLEDKAEQVTFHIFVINRTNGKNRENPKHCSCTVSNNAHHVWGCLGHVGDLLHLTVNMGAVVYFGSTPDKQSCCHKNSSGPK